jgi:hypothetical protein
MTLQTSLQRPRTSLVLFHCLFGDHGLRSHAEHACELQTYLALPHLIALCAIDERCRPERMVAGLLVKTNHHPHEPGFLEAMAAAFQAVPPLCAVLHEDSALQAAPVDADFPRPLNESEALFVFRQLWAEHVAGQLAARFR